MSNQPNSTPVAKYLNALGEGKNLNDVLVDLARDIEAASPVPLYASILLLDASGRKLFRGAAPSLPESYSREIDGIEVGPNVGSCGTAVYCGHSIYVCDIERDELWASFKELASKNGLKACWSVPITSSTDQILGTFALYYSEVRNPILEERKFIEDCARTAAILIEESTQSLRTA